MQTRTLSSLHPLPIDDLKWIFSKGRPLWGELAGKKLFLTGGTGFFGRWLVESFVHVNSLLELRAELTILSRNPEKFAPLLEKIGANNSVQLLQGSLLDFAFPKTRFPLIIHAGGPVPQSGIPLVSSQIFDEITEGTRRVLEFSKACGTQNFLFLSSGAVYGPQPAKRKRMGETFLGGPAPAETRSSYAEGKRAAEFLCSVFSREASIPIAIARCFSQIGPAIPLEGTYAAGNFIRDALAGKPIKITGDGRTIRTYMYAADLTLWLWTLLLKGTRSGQPELTPYNVGSEVETSVLSLAKAIRKLTKNPHPIEIRNAPSESHAQGQRYVPSTQRARKEFDLGENFTLEESLKRTISWLRA